MKGGAFYKKLEFYSRSFPKGRTKRILLFTLLLFALLNILAIFIPDLAYTGKRLPEDNKLLINEAVDYIQNLQTDKGVIVFTGDSVIYGHNLNGEESIPVQYSNLLSNNFLVFDLAMEAAWSSDQYFIIKRIIDSADVIFVDIHPRFFSQDMKGIDAYTYAELWENPEITNDDLKHINKEKGFDDNLNILLQERLAEFLPLYKKRNIISYYLFGASPKFRIFNFIQVNACVLLKGRENCEKTTSPFYLRSEEAKQRAIPKIRAELNITYIGDDSGYISYLQKIIQLANEKNKRLVLYTVQINPRLNEEYSLMEKEIYEKNIQPIRALAPCSSNILFIDYNYNPKKQLDATDFFDGHHLTAEGSKKLASWLYEDTKEFIE